MEFLVVTGLSGAGKSKAMEMLEDIGFVCIDNLPPKLLPSLGQILEASESAARTAVVVDARSGASYKTLSHSLQELNQQHIGYKLLFIDCADDVLLRRYSETRRRHPLARKYRNSLKEAVAAEREMMDPLKQEADYIIDTTGMEARQLKDRIAALFAGSVENTLQVQCISFGFKYGIPPDANIVFDMRCLPNPFYIPELRTKTGMDPEVYDYVMSFESSRTFLQKMADMIDYSLPLYLKQGKSDIVLAFGCTGGQHRSVTFAEAVYRHLKERGVRVSVLHRDAVKNSNEVKSREE